MTKNIFWVWNINEYDSRRIGTQNSRYYLENDNGLVYINALCLATKFIADIQVD